MQNRMVHKTDKMRVIESQVGVPLEQFMLEKLMEYKGNITDISRYVSTNIMPVDKSTIYRWFRDLGIQGEALRIQKIFGTGHSQYKYVEGEVFDIKFLSAVNGLCYQCQKDFRELQEPLVFRSMVRNQLIADPVFSVTIEDRYGQPHFYDLELKVLTEVLESLGGVIGEDDDNSSEEQTI